MRHTKHLWRAGLILIFTVGGGVLVRSKLVPATYGQYGSYRAADVETQRSKPIAFGAPGSCAPCHADQNTKHDAGVHKTVTCESCHAPLATHASGDKVTGKMEITKDAALCLRCHRKLEARPKSFPQIELAQHMKDNGVEFTSDVCFSCHDPHSPKEDVGAPATPPVPSPSPTPNP